MRQGGNNTKSFIFRTALIELYNNSISDLTQKLLLTKYKQGLFINKITGFNNVIQLYSIYAAVSKYNTIYFYNLLQLVIAIKLVDTSVGVQRVTSN